MMGFFTLRPLCAGIVLAGTLAIPAGASPEINRHKDEETLRRELDEKAEIQRQHLVPMRDGIGLSTDVYLPKERTGKVPAVFWRTPYDYDPIRKGLALQIHEALDRGYAFVIQNERGKFFSDGDWEILGRPQTDGADALDWIADQEWSTGRVGLLGCSSPAEWQLALAAQKHPALAALVPAAPGAGIGKAGVYVEQGNWYRGGAEQMFYPPWLHNSVQPDIRPRFPAELTREQRAKMAEWYDLSPDVPESDWTKLIKTLPLKDMAKEAGLDNRTFSEFVARTPASPEWRDGGLFYDDTMQIEAPALWLFSWFDVSIAPNLALYRHARANPRRTVADAQYAVVGPNLHCRFWSDEVGKVGEKEFENADVGAYKLVFDFFDRYVKGRRNGFERRTPKVRYYDLGAEEWKTARQWPPRKTRRVTFGLTSQKGANSLFGDGVLQHGAVVRGGAGSSAFTYDPMNPVPSLGGGICCIGGALEGGMYDQRGIEARADVLVYTSAPLEAPLAVAGPVDVTLYVSSDAPDTDFTVKLIDVHPDGSAYNLDETVQRMRWRSGYAGEPVFMEEGAVYEIAFQPMVTANRFKAGHRIRLEVSSSNFPRFSRNLNTGGPIHEEREPRIAHNTVHYGEGQASSLTLTVVDD